jgi:hypothetical protein
MVLRLEIETWEIGKCSTKRGSGKGKWVREKEWGPLGFVALVHVRVYFYSCHEW